MAFHEDQSIDHQKLKNMKLKALLTLALFLILLSAQSQDLPIKDLPKQVDVPEKTLGSYTGHYKIDQMSLVIEILLEDGKLYADVAGMGKLLLKAGAQNAFMVEGIEAQLEFTDIAGKAGKIRLYQGGAVMEGQRIPAPKQIDYKTIEPGSHEIDYSKIYSPFESEWDLIINGTTVGMASIELRHTLCQGQPAYAHGSIIRYTSMGNKPFADKGCFAKESYSPLEARNAISQQEEIITTHHGRKSIATTINIQSGEVIKTDTSEIGQAIFGAGIYQLLSMDLVVGMAVKFPVAGFSGLNWEKVKVAGKEQLQIEGFDEPFDTWRIEYNSGTTKWLTNQAPYLVRWEMPTGMLWQLKSYH